VAGIKKPDEEVLQNGKIELPDDEVIATQQVML